MAHDDLIYEMEERAKKAQDTYGHFASTHEALGVACEEWDELRDAIRANKLGSVEQECLDLAAVLLRLARHCRNVIHNPDGPFALRSVKCL
jgi:NTP pyrophosphatase (non-canonical NTP hydrolase)